MSLKKNLKIPLILWRKKEGGREFQKILKNKKSFLNNRPTVDKNRERWTRKEAKDRGEKIAGADIPKGGIGFPWQKCMAEGPAWKSN